jgi:TrpR-related protein YerC/YecD
MSGKVKYHELTELEKKAYLGEFYTMVSLLKDRNDVKIFFKDLLTLSEVVMISRRIQIAKFLLEGYTHEKIKRKLKVGLATITQVEKWVNNGFGGYKKIIKEYIKQNKNKKNKKDFMPTPFTHEWTKRKYPLHYLFSNLLDKYK